MRFKSAVGGLIVVGLVSGLVAVYLQTKPTRSSVQTFVALIGAANRGDVSRAERLCSKRYRETHTIKAAVGGGIEGLPRNIHKNFQVWRDGASVLLCPTNRVGPVYRFVFEEATWRFDGPTGILGADGLMEPYGDHGEIVEEQSRARVKPASSTVPML